MKAKILKPKQKAKQEAKKSKTKRFFKENGLFIKAIICLLFGAIIFGFCLFGLSNIIEDEYNIDLAEKGNFFFFIQVLIISGLSCFTSAVGLKLILDKFWETP